MSRRRAGGRIIFVKKDGLPRFIGSPFFTMDFLKDGEKVEDLMIGGLKIIQSDKLYRFSSDSILLSKFAEYKKGDVVADFCAGSGIVGLHFYALNPSAERIDLYELQKPLCDMAERSVALNSLQS
ncbi:MAG TPA: hypothetical protein DDW54_03515, partial [Clostridiales bacterium]|nr:hypothetical protein [Clostridiales bacterium]